MRAIVYFLLAFCITSCNKLEDPITRINKKLNNTSDEGFRRNIPEFYNDSSIIYMPYAWEERSRIGLPSIDKGSEVLEIRIWEELDWGRTVLILKYNDNVWTAKDYMYRGVSNAGDHVDSISIAVDTIHLMPPKAGWSKFMNKLIDRGILELKDESEIPEYPKATDMEMTAVEIATKSYYGYYELSGVKTMAKNIPDAMAMSKILDLIKDEFPQIMSQIKRY